MYIIKAEEKDISYLQGMDHHISYEELVGSIHKKRVFIAIEEEKRVGFLRYGLFWDNTPFMNLLYVEESYRNKGYGKALISFFEEEMKHLGYSFILTSTLEEESAKSLYFKLGFKRIGDFQLPNEGNELILYKKI